MNTAIKYPDAKQVIVSGDIHGDFKGIVYKLCVQYGLKDSLLIIAGDCGFGFEKRTTGLYSSGEITMTRPISPRRKYPTSAGNAFQTIPSYKLVSTISFASAELPVLTGICVRTRMPAGGKEVTRRPQSGGQTKHRSSMKTLLTLSR